MGFFDKFKKTKLDKDSIPVRSTWTPIYSGKTNKLIAGVRDNCISIYIENGVSAGNGTWAEIGYIKDFIVYSEDQEIGELFYDEGEFDCIVNRSRQINISKNFWEEELNRSKQSGFQSSADIAESKLETLKNTLPYLCVGRTSELPEKNFSSVFLFDEGKNIGNSEECVLYSIAKNSEQNFSKYALAATFLIVQYWASFDDIDRPLKALWDF